MNRGECCIEKFKECCCTCNNHVRDYEHCTTNPLLRMEKKTCICSISKGYICTAPEMEGMHSNWGEHGLCEMWYKKNKKE